VGYASISHARLCNNLLLSQRRQNVGDGCVKVGHGIGHEITYYLRRDFAGKGVLNVLRGDMTSLPLHLVVNWRVFTINDQCFMPEEICDSQALSLNEGVLWSSDADCDFNAAFSLEQQSLPQVLSSSTVTSLANACVSAVNGSIKDQSVMLLRVTVVHTATLY